MLLLFFVEQWYIENFPSVTVLVKILLHGWEYQDNFQRQDFINHINKQKRIMVLLLLFFVQLLLY